MARVKTPLMSIDAKGTVGKTIVYTKGIRGQIAKADRLVKNFGIPIIFFEIAGFGELCQMLFPDMWFKFFNFSQFFTYFTKRPYTSNTTAQQTARNKFKSGNIAWNNLTEEEKNVYRTQAVDKPLTGYNIFMKEYIEEN